MPLSDENKPPKTLEKQLLKRLNIVGGVLFLCAVSAWLYQLIPQTVDEYVEEIEEEIEPMNTLFVSAVFTTVGSSCFIISWRKRKSFQKETE